MPENAHFQKLFQHIILENKRKSDTIPVKLKQREKDMYTKSSIKLLTAILAVILMIIPALTSCGKTNSETESETEPVVLSTNYGTAVDTSSSSSTSATAEATSTVSVGGVVIRSQISGAYSIKGFQGFAVRMGADAIRALSGIAGTPFVRAYDITTKSSQAAFATINAAAASVGATVLGAINVDLGQMNGGKFTSLPNTVAVPATIGVAAAGGRTLAVVKVLPGGAFEILQDTDEVSVTVTFSITGGLAAYAVIAY